MLSFVFLFAIASVSSALTLPQADPSTGIDDLSSLINGADCSFYTAVNTLLQCGPKSHLMQYSYKYCQRLLTIRETFENTQYQDAARECLQKKLFDQVKKIGQASLTCDGLKKLDLDSHGSCLAVSFKQLSGNDVQQFLAVFKDTTVNYAQLCKLANSFAGHWSQIVKGDLMVFVKNQLSQTFPEGDATSCSIKEKEIVEEIEELVEGAKGLIEKVKGIKDDIILIIEKAKAIRDEYKSIRETIQGMKNGSISELDGTKLILEKSKSIVDNANTIINTIKKIVNAKPSPSGDGDIDRVLNDLISIVNQTQALKGEVFNVVDNVNDIIDLVKQIRDGKIDVFDGLEAIVGQVETGYENIYSIIGTMTSIEVSAVDIFETIFKGLGGAVDELIEEGKEKVDEITGEITGGLGGLGGIGK